LVTDEGDQLHRQVKEPPVPNGPRSLSWRSGEESNPDYSVVQPVS
jgi:hypothetical protein